MNDIPPPKLKSSRGKKRESKPIASLAKARQSARLSMKKQQTKLNKLKSKLQSATRVAQTKKENLKHIEKVLDGKEIQVIDERILESIPDNVRDLIDTQNVVFKPNKGPQTQFLASAEKEVFYGGARGGGKSYAMLVDPLRYCTKQNHRALLIRKTMPELRDMITHSQRLYGKAYPGARWREQEKEWRFPSGARIEFGYADNMTDALRYQGQSYTWIGIDELPQYPTPDIYNFLRSSLRSVDPEIPVFMRATGNPGNVGSQWVREMFVNPSQPNVPFHINIDTPTGIKKITRRFIPQNCRIILTSCRRKITTQCCLHCRRCKENNFWKETGMLLKIQRFLNLIKIYILLNPLTSLAVGLAFVLVNGDMLLLPVFYGLLLIGIIISGFIVNSTEIK